MDLKKIVQSVALFGSMMTTATGQDFFPIFGRDAVCSASLAYLNQRLSGQLDADALGIQLLTKYKTVNQFLPPKAYALPSGLTVMQVDDYDFDNDGVLDHVFEYLGAGSYVSGTLLFVALNGSDPFISGSDALNVSAFHSYPCQFDKSVSASSSCPGVSQDNDEAGLDVLMSGGKKIHFRDRYTEITPIKFNGMTYLILGSASYNTRKYSAVIKPSAKSNYDSICVFKRT